MAGTCMPEVAKALGWTDEEIIRSVLEGNLLLFEILMRRHNQRIYRAVRSILRNDAECEDVMQETYVSAFAHLSQFAGRAKFSTWLTRIAVNEAIKRYSKLTSGLVVLAALIPALAQTQAAREAGKEHGARQAPASPAQIARGQEVFNQNCSRCHNAPQGIPPQISATVIRHMRVRASLSAADEKALLRFMNP